MNLFVSFNRSHRLTAVIGFIVALLLTQNVRSDITIMMVLCVSLGVVSGYFVRETARSNKFDRAKLLRIGLLAVPGLLFIHFRIFSLYPWNLAKFIIGGSFNSLTNEMPQGFLGFLGGSMQLGSVDFTPPLLALLL